MFTDEIVTLDGLIDQNEDNDLIFARRDSERQSLSRDDASKSIEHFYRIKCEGYNKAMTDIAKSRVLPIFFAFVQFDSEIIYLLAETDIIRIEPVLVEIMKSGKNFSHLQIKEEILNIIHAK